MYYIIYKITNNKNGKHYIGAHKTTDVDDGYMGSGKILARSIKKYGIENFTKEILFVFDTSEEMFAKEKELVNEEFVARNDTYNLKVGGFGGWDHITTEQMAERNRKISAKRDYSKTNRSYYTNDIKTKAGRAISIAQKRRYENGKINGFYNHQHTDEAKSKISLANKGKNKGNNNSQFGSCWVYNTTLKQNKKIKKKDLRTYLDDNWVAGRKMKF
jgi:hypothetical protein